MTICPLCQMFVGPDDTEHHDKHHAELMEIIEPHVHTEFLKMVEAQGSLVHVDWSSPEWLRHELYMRGKLFKSELDLEGVYWFADGNEDENAHGFLFNDESGQCGHGSIIGGCVVRWKTYDDGPERWLLDWAWVAPKARNMGVFSQHWAKLSEYFEGLQLAPYLGPARKSHKATLAKSRDVPEQPTNFTQPQHWGDLRLPLRGSLEPIARV